MKLQRYLIVFTDNDLGNDSKQARVELYTSDSLPEAERLAELLYQMQRTNAEAFGGYPGGAEVYDTKADNFFSAADRITEEEEANAE